MLKIIKILLLIFIISLQVFIIIYLGFKIKNQIQTGNVKGIQYTTDLSKQIEFSDDNKELKYFYELKANATLKDSPEWLGYTAVNTINNDSLNERYDYSLEKKPSTYRIITLGDSWTYGAYVNTEDNYSEVLEDMLNSKLRCNNIDKFEVINLGVGGYDIEYTVMRFKKRGVKYNPDLVIWLINDWNMDNINEVNIPLQKEYINQGIPSLDIENGGYVAAVKAMEFNRKKFGKNYIDNYQKNRMKDFLNRIKQKLLLLKLDNSSKEKLDFLKILLADNHNFFITDSINNPDKNNSLMLPDRHPNKFGHQRMSDNIFTYITENIITECELRKL